MDNYKYVGLEVCVRFGVLETTRFTYVEYWLKFLFWVGYLFEYSWCKTTRFTYVRFGISYPSNNKS